VSLIPEAVERLRSRIEGSGCEDGVVVLKQNPDASRCQYERGVTLEAHFGGGRGQVVTPHPIQGTTRISSMFGSPLASPEERSAALAILNAATGFLCLSRKLRPCPEECYGPCLSELRKHVGRSQVYCIGTSPVIQQEFSSQGVNDPAAAEVILVVGGGVITDSLLTQVEVVRENKIMIFLGPSFAGLSSLLNQERWCPYGR
jgi:hypothetical protein